MTRLYEKKDNLIRKNPNLTEEQKQEIIEVLNKYPNLENNVDWNKNKYLTYEDFKELILDKAGKSRSQAKKKGVSGLTEGIDYDILYDKDGETLYAVYTHLASKVLASNRVEPQIWTESEVVIDWSEEDDYSGSKTYRNEEGKLVELKPGAKWCISMNDPYHWEKYTTEGIIFFFWFRNDDTLEDKYKKVAIGVDKWKNRIVSKTGGSDKRYDITLPSYLKKVINTSTKEKREKERQELVSKFILNPKTNRYDYDGTLSGQQLEDFISKDEKCFTINFGKISGNFYCFRLGLKSLKGAPTEVEGDFNCSENQLTSLEGAPQTVGGNFWCSYNQLTSLEGAPQKVGKTFICTSTHLTSLKGAPQYVGKGFNCSYNQLTSLKGAPKEVGETFNCRANPNLHSLEGIGKVKGEIDKDF